MLGGHLNIIVGGHLNWMAKIKLRGPGPLDQYYCWGPLKLGLCKYYCREPIQIGWQILNWRSRAPWINIFVNFCSTRVLLYARTLKETETEETVVFFVMFLSLVAFQLGREAFPPGYAYGLITDLKLKMSVVSY